MSKIVSIVLRERKLLFSLYFRQVVTHKRNLSLLTQNVISSSFCTKEGQNQMALLSFERKMSIFSKIKTKVYNLISENTKAKVGAALAYEKVGDNIDYTEFLQYFKLPDTFQSWFLAVQLHVWITVSATIMHPKAKVFKVTIVDSMWNDVELRMEKLAEMKSSTRKKYLKDLVQEFHACFIAYDEGILSEDKVLAAAAWRMLFACKSVHPQLLENAVLYIRKQLEHVESQQIQDIVFKGRVTFLPLKSIVLDSEM